MEPVRAVTPAQMAAIDRLMAERFGVQPIQLMEIAGRAVALFARDRFLQHDPAGKRVVVLCGTGGNGGDGLVAARHLHAWGAEVTVWLSRQPDGLTGQHLASLERLAVETHGPEESVALGGCDLAIDALLGFSAGGDPRGRVAELIDAVNRQPAPVLAVDLPSGLNAETGAIGQPCVRATATLTLAYPKTGLLADGAAEAIGELHAADIGVPAEAYKALGLTVEVLFSRAETVKIPGKHHQLGIQSPR
jgi:NAD(P)H-hydrate epimerase